MKRNSFYLSPLPVLFLIASLALPPQSAQALRAPSTKESAGLKQLTAGLEETVLSRQERKRQVLNSLGGIPAPGQLAVALGVNNSEVRVSMNVSADQPSAFLLNAVLRQDDLSAHPLMPLFPVPSGEPGLYTARFDLRKLEEALQNVDPSAGVLRAQLETPLQSRDRAAVVSAIGVTLANGFASADEARRRIEDLKKQHPNLALQMDQAVARVREVISRELRFHGLVMDSMDRLGTVAVGGQVPFQEASADLDKLLGWIEFWPRNHVAVQSLIDAYRQQGTPAPIDVVEDNWKSYWEGVWQERLQVLPQTISTDALNAVYYPAIWLELHEQLEQGRSAVSDRYLEGIGLQLLWLGMEQVATAFWLTGAQRVQRPSQNGIPISGDRIFLLKPGEAQTSWQVVREVAGSPSIVLTGTPAPFYPVDRVSPLWKEDEATAIALGFTSLIGFPDADQWERFFEDGFYLQSQLPGRPEIWMAVTDLQGAVHFYRPRMPPGDLKQWIETGDRLKPEIRNIQSIIGDLFQHVWSQISYLPEDQIRALLALPPPLVLGQPRPPAKNAAVINQETAGHKGQIVTAARGFQGLIRTQLGKHFGDSSVQMTMARLEERLPEELKALRSVQFEQVPDVISRLLYLTALILSESYAQTKLPLDTLFEEVIIPGVSPEPVTAISSSAPSVRFPIPAPAPPLSKPDAWAKRQAELDQRMGKMLSIAIPKLKADPSMTGLPVEELVEAFARDWVVKGTMTKRAKGSSTPVPILPLLQAGTWSPIDATVFVQAFLNHRQAASRLLDEIAVSGDEVVTDPQQLSGLFGRLNSAEVIAGGETVTARISEIRQQLFERHLVLSLAALQQQAPLSSDGAVDASRIQAFQQQVRLARESWSALAGLDYQSETLDRAKAWSEAASQMTTLVSHLAAFSSPSNGSYGNSWKVLSSYLGQARNLLPALGPNWESWAGPSLRSAVERFLTGLFGRLNELEALPTENSKWGETQNLYDEARSFLFEEGRLRDSWLSGSDLLNSFEDHQDWFLHRRAFLENRNLSETNIKRRLPFTLGPNQQMVLAIYDEDGHMTDDWILIRPKQIHPEDRVSHEKRIDVAVASRFHSVETVSGRRLGALLQREDRALDFLKWLQEVGRKELPDDADPPDAPRIEEVTLGVIPSNGRRPDLIDLTQPFAAFHQTNALKQYVAAAGIQSLPDVKNKGPQLVSTLIKDAPLSIELASVEGDVIAFRVFQQILRTDDEGQSTGEYHYPYIVTIQDQPEHPPTETPEDAATAGLEENLAPLEVLESLRTAFAGYEQVVLMLSGFPSKMLQQHSLKLALGPVPPGGVLYQVQPLLMGMSPWSRLALQNDEGGAFTLVARFLPVRRNYPGNRAPVVVASRLRALALRVLSEEAGFSEAFQQAFGPGSEQRFKDKGEPAAPVELKETELRTLLGMEPSGEPTSRQKMLLSISPSLLEVLARLVREMDDLKDMRESSAAPLTLEQALDALTRYPGLRVETQIRSADQEPFKLDYNKIEEAQTRSAIQNFMEKGLVLTGLSSAGLEEAEAAAPMLGEVLRAMEQVSGWEKAVLAAEMSQGQFQAEVRALARRGIFNGELRTLTGDPVLQFRLRRDLEDLYGISQVEWGSGAFLVVLNDLLGDLELLAGQVGTGSRRAAELDAIRDELALTQWDRLLRLMQIRWETYEPYGPKPLVFARPTAMGYYFPTDPFIAVRFLQRAGLREWGSVLDLGSGAGHILLPGASVLSLMTSGFEVDPELLAENNLWVQGALSDQLIVPGQVQVSSENFLTASWPEAEVIVHFPQIGEGGISDQDLKRMQMRLLQYGVRHPGVRLLLVGGREGDPLFTAAFSELLSRWNTQWFENPAMALLTPSQGTPVKSDLSGLQVMGIEEFDRTVLRTELERQRLHVMREKGADVVTVQEISPSFPIYVQGEDLHKVVTRSLLLPKDAEFRIYRIAQVSEFENLGLILRDTRMLEIPLPAHPDSLAVLTISPFDVPSLNPDDLIGEMFRDRLGIPQPEYAGGMLFTRAGKVYAALFSSA